MRGMLELVQKDIDSIRKQAEKLYHEGENNCYIKKRSKGHDWKSAPYKGDIYKGQEEFHGIDMKKFWR